VGGLGILGGLSFTVDLTVVSVFLGGLGALALLVFVGEKSAKRHEK